jgi:hypothetical protein
LDYGFVLGYMGGDTNQGRSRYKTFVEQGIKQDLDNPLKLGIGSGIVGSEEFITELKQMLGIQGEAGQRTTGNEAASPGIYSR